MTDQFRNITFPPENDGFFAELREEVNAYFKKSGNQNKGKLCRILKSQKTQKKHKIEHKTVRWLNGVWPVGH